MNQQEGEVNTNIQNGDTGATKIQQMGTLKDETLNELKAFSAKFHDTDVDKNIDTKDASEYLEYMEKLLREPFDENHVEFYEDLTQCLIELKLLEVISKIILEWSDEQSLFLMALNLVVKLVHESDTLAEAIAKTEVMEMCKKFLQDHSQLYVEFKLEDSPKKIVISCIALVQNVSLRNENIERLRSLNFVEIVKPYLKLSNDQIGLVALIILANIVNEEECSIFKLHVLLVSHLLWNLKQSIFAGNRMYLGWSCKELGHAVRNLARNDSNKKLLWNLNALQILIKMAKTGSKKEILESVHAIWALLFDEEIRQRINTSLKGKGVLDLLYELQEQSLDPEILSVINEALWTLRDVPDTYKRLHTVCTPKVPTHAVAERHIMISYQTSNRDVLCRIRDALKERNYKVWMDVDDICGSTVESMAQAVQNAAVVLVCYSRSYKDSYYCRSEAEYAYECRKPIVPLKMEANYTPDGWLGLIIRAKIYIDFSGESEFKETLEKLFKEIKMQGIFSESSQVNHKPVVVTSAARVVPNQRHENNDISVIDTIREWNRNDVLEWLTKNDLKGHRLEELTGEVIALMVTMQMEVPNQLHDCIQNDLQIKQLDVKARLFFALRDLPRLLKASKVTTNAGTFQSFCNIL